MDDSKTEIAARYHVVTLLYRGKIAEAELALNQFVSAGTIGTNAETFYRDLLTAAKSETLPGTPAKDIAKASSDPARPAADELQNL